ncbi:TetR/AcrR family transcriptional regulator [Agrobacterium sp. NPDC089420]|uniref:TetR/AcrR family transcriptional regulator n=1 Tax=Agrobacterium sp. NPDC089420 TaxID=3363918 RepID=UPI00385141F4
MEKQVSNPRRVRRTALATRVLILHEARRSFIVLGHKKTSISDIAVTLNMSPANVFKHFHSKAELAHAVLIDRFRSGRKIRGLTPLARIRNFLFDLLVELNACLKKEPLLFAVMTTFLTADEVDQLLRDHMVAGIREALADIPLPHETERMVEMLADAFLCVLHPAIIGTTRQAELRSRADNVLLLVELAICRPAR